MYVSVYNLDLTQIGYEYYIKFLDALASLRPRRPRIAIDNLRIQTWILRLSPNSFWIAKITTESISENWDCVNIISNVKCQ